MLCSQKSATCQRRSQTSERAAPPAASFAPNQSCRWDQLEDSERNMRRERYEDKGDEVGDSQCMGRMRKGWRWGWRGEGTLRRRSQEPCRPGWQLLQVCVWQNNHHDDFYQWLYWGERWRIWSHTLIDQMTRMMRWEPNSLTDSSHPVRGLSRGIGSEDQRRFLETQSFAKWSRK